MSPKQASGAQKRKRKREDEKMVKSQTGALLRFYFLPKPPIKDHVEVEVEHEEEHVEVEHVEVEHMEVHVEDGEEHVEVEHVEKVHVEEQVKHNPIDIFDPRRWDGLNADEIKLLVEKGPKRDNDIEYGPYNEDTRRFTTALYTRTLENLEKVDRPWAVYSKETDKLYCFCCKLFRKGSAKGTLDGIGFSNWQQAFRRLRLHELTSDHLNYMNVWFDMRNRLRLNETIDKIHHEQFKKERDYWMEVFLRVIALVKFLAKHNLAFRGSKEKLYQKGNGNFLGLIEMLEEFDLVIKEHVRRITSNDLHVHYLGHNIQNELILMLGHEIKKEIIKRIKEAKYYSIILDCTPDSSHQEQMSLIVRYVKLESSSVSVEESFLGYLNVNDTTGLGLFEVTLKELESLSLEIDDMRGQGYDNGSNMKGKHQGVQTRFLQKNPRAFYTPGGCHSLNLTLCDIANSCLKGKKFFGQIQRIYTIFANSIKRWEILKDNVKGWSLKSLSETRWESRVESVKAIKLQLSDVREALVQVGEKNGDAAIASEASSLAENELGQFDFLVSIVIWYQVLNHVNIVSKNLQSKDMNLDTVIKEISRLIEYFKEYRETGFTKVVDEAKELTIEMDIDPIFLQKRVIKRKKHFDDSSRSQECSFTPEEDFRVNYFLFLVDQAIASLETRFEQFKTYEKLFGFLFPHKLRVIADEDLMVSCQLLEKELKFKGRSDISVEELYIELKLFDESRTTEFRNPIDVLEYLRHFTHYPIACVAYRILLTIPITVASVEKSFSKLKLLKSYLRFTMSQERLNGLAIIAIENEVLESINCKEMITEFAGKNVRRAS